MFDVGILGGPWVACSGKRSAVACGVQFRTGGQNMTHDGSMTDRLTEIPSRFSMVDGNDAILARTSPWAHVCSTMCAMMVVGTTIATRASAGRIHVNYRHYRHIIEIINKLPSFNPSWSTIITSTICFYYLNSVIEESSSRALSIRYTRGGLNKWLVTTD